MPDIKTIERNPAKRTTNSVQPAQVAHPFTLGDTLTKGSLSIQETLKLLSQNEISNVVENATVLENVSPDKSASKVKYKILHLNSKEDDGELEDYLLKIRSPYDEGVIENPEDILRDVYDSCNSIKSLFSKESESKEDIELSKKRYFKAVSMHGTFAPLYSSGIFSSPPLPGSKVRLHYFQSPMVSSGEPIAGFYEKMYDDDIFEEACSEIAKLLSVFRAAFEKAAKIVTPTKSNIPTVAAATSAPPAEGTVGSPVGPTTTAPELVGDLGSVSDSRWPPRDLVTQFIGDPAAPSRQLYDTVIDQFQVETNPRYTPRKLYPSDEKQATFCNIFAADVTWAMGLPLPQKIDANGDPQPMSEPLKKGGTTQGCTLMLRWLRGRGKAYEWKEVSEKEAQENANKGLVTVACAKKHISVVRPAKSGEKEVPVCAQAGARVVNYRPVSKCFIYKEFTRKDGSVEPADPPYFFTCFRKTRYTNPTKEQLDSLSAQTSIEQQSIEQTSASSVGTEEQQSTTSQ